MAYYIIINIYACKKTIKYAVIDQHIHNTCQLYVSAGYSKQDRLLISIRRSQLHVFNLTAIIFITTTLTERDMF